MPHLKWGTKTGPHRSNGNGLIMNEDKVDESEKNAIHTFNFRLPFRITLELIKIGSQKFSPYLFIMFSANK